MKLLTLNGSASAIDRLRSKYPSLPSSYFALLARSNGVEGDLGISWVQLWNAGYSPRPGIPDIHVYTIGSRLRRTRTHSDFVGSAAYEAYLANNPNNESNFIFPIEEGDWQSPSNDDRC
jgi:hypothetical protein